MAQALYDPLEATILFLVCNPKRGPYFDFIEFVARATKENKRRKEKWHQHLEQKTRRSNCPERLNSIHLKMIEVLASEKFAVLRRFT